MNALEFGLVFAAVYMFGMMLLFIVVERVFDWWYWR